MLGSIVATRKSSDEIGRLNDQGLITDFFVCDYLNSLYKQGKDVLEKRVQRPADVAFKRLHACEATGVSQYQIAIDYHCEIFQSLHNSEVDQRINAQQLLEIHVRYDEQRHAWVNIHTDTQPAVFHFNGGAKAHVDTVIARLALPTWVSDDQSKSLLLFDDRPNVRYANECP